MDTVHVHKIASVVYRLGFAKEVEITHRLEARAGNAVVVRALNEKRVYSELEVVGGRMSKIFRGDLFIGALGRRRALRGFAGDVPPVVKAGDILALLNRGGVLGGSATAHKDLGQPVACEVLGMPVRDGRIANVSDGALAALETLEGIDVPPVVIVSGTCMESGKTLVISELIQQLSKSGWSLAGGKLTGIACLRDLVSMEDHGAAVTLSFLDAGHPSTAGLTGAELATIARTVIGHLAAHRPDGIVVELGDGILGDYGVLAILKDPEIARAVRMHIFCAVDPVGAWGGFRYLEEQGIGIDLFSGPATDNNVGAGYLKREFSRPAVNAFLDPESLAAAVSERLGSPRGCGSRRRGKRGPQEP